MLTQLIHCGGRPLCSDRSNNSGAYFVMGLSTTAATYYHESKCTIRYKYYECVVGTNTSSSVAPHSYRYLPT